MQGTKEWFDKRLGRFTASDIYKLMGRDLNTDGAQKYILQKATEHITGNHQEDDIKSKYLEWGNRWEYEAKEYYRQASGNNLGEIDFVVCYISDHAGCSPDLIGAEIKCPYFTYNHINHGTIKSPADFKKRFKQYYWQVVMNMFCLEKESWDFVSYDNRLTGAKRMFRTQVVRDEIKEDIKLLQDRILEAAKIKMNIVNTIESL